MSVAATLHALTTGFAIQTEGLTKRFGRTVAVQDLSLTVPPGDVVVGASLSVGAAVGGFLLQVVAQSTGAPEWVGRHSPFAHLAAVPDAPLDWMGLAWLTVVAVVLMVIGVLGYLRRDLAV